MRQFFYPTSVAVIGVSPRAENLGRNIVANLVEFEYQGVVHPVGPRGGVIETHRIYPSVDDIPDTVDLAVVFTPAETVPGVLDACGQKGIRHAIIETAGFREYTDRGRQLEAQITEVARRWDMRFVGPNCIGVINMENGFCVPFPRIKKFFKQGNVSIITQSGGVGMSALNLMANEGLGLNKFVSVGNMLDTTAEDMLEFLIEDEGTHLVFMYLETIGDGRRLMDLARRSPKPILLFKSNIGRLGVNIALSHTASLASDDKVVEAACYQAGIIRVHDATTFGNNLKILSLSPMKGRRLAIISRSGGHAVIAADACELSGFELAEFPQSFLREIEKHFRASVIRLTNPLDLGDLFDLDVYAQIVEGTLQLPDVDGVVFLHTSLSEAENLRSRLLLERLMGLAARYDKPVAYYISTAAQEVNYLKQSYNFPIFTQVVETIRALEMSHYYHSRSLDLRSQQPTPSFSVDRPTVLRILSAVQRPLLGEIQRPLLDEALSPFFGEKDLELIRQTSAGPLLLPEALSILKAYSIPTASWASARTLPEAQSAAAQLGYPVALKVISAEISHKSDVGGVRLNLGDPQGLSAAWHDMLSGIQAAHPGARLEGALLQPMLSGGHELILGGRRDPQFGPVVLLGLGGIFVEVFDEAVIRVAPITRQEAEEMLLGLRGSAILHGARGQPPADLPALVEALLRLSQLLVDFPQIKEVDINPLRVFPAGGGCLALDARIILAN